MTVTMSSSSTVRVPVIVKEEQSDNVRNESSSSDRYNQFWICNLSVIDESSDSLHSDRETEREEEDTVDQST